MVRKYETIILGAGLSGLLANYFNRGSLVLERASRIGGNFNDKTVPKYLHNVSEIRELYSELGIELKYDKIKIGIYYNDRIYDFNDKSLGEEIVKLYSIKTKHKVDLLSMNKYLFRFEDKYISNCAKLIDRLNYSNIEINSDVISVDLLNRVITTKEDKIKYSKLISTIPINIFANISNLNISLLSRSRKIASVIVSKLIASEINNFDFIYFPEKKYSFNRITKFNNRITFEFPDCSEEIIYNNIIRFLEDNKIDLSFSLDIREFKFYSYEDNIKIDDVKFVGRFATGSYSTEIHDVIRELK